ncbi:MAG: hypothetical protein ACI8XZ_003308 [Gammaproteobacteria bacterium]|jgi:hypothetical protein
MRDNMNDLGLAGATVITQSDNIAIVSPIIDTKGSDGLTFLIGAGTLADADATFTVLVEDGDDAALSDAAAVVDLELVGTELLAGFQFDDDNAARKIGYIGNKRYARCTVTPINNAGSAPVAIIPVKGFLHLAPATNP